MIKLLIVDDQALMRDGLATLLNMRQDLEVIGTASNGQEAYLKAGELSPDMILMDIRMPVMNGVEGTRKIRADYPSVKVLMLTTFNDSELIFEAMDEGASGYLLKDMAMDTIEQAIRTVHAGGIVLPEETTRLMLKEIRKTAVNPAGKQQLEIPEIIQELTERELDVLKLLGAGMNNKEIADDLYITEGTVKNHVSHIISKLALRDRTQAAIFAVRHGIKDFENGKTDA